MHPSLMVCNTPKRQHSRPEKAPNEITGLESPQRRRFLREQRNDQAASAQSR
ncbi:hypothetical protein SynNOUM97013_01949 [Synechococcus sp. NOUM97013]|nr:hypothetical protein SynNOUM97013_01949 [Synechococcus sp. NOUM97013]